MTEDEYDVALVRIWQLMNKPELTDEEDNEFNELVNRVLAYEKEHFLDES